MTVILAETAVKQGAKVCRVTRVQAMCANLALDFKSYEFLLPDYFIKA